MEESEATTTCPNCKREIPSRNFMTHSVHCTRNIKICTVCKEPVPQSELQDHHDKFHMLAPCKKCQEMVRGTDMEDHIRDSCAFTMQTCRFCSLELRRHDMPAHERYCGARTERCGDCGEYVMLRYRQLHADSNHTFICLDDDIPQNTLGRPFRSSVQTTPARQESAPLQTNLDRPQLTDIQRRILDTFPLFNPPAFGVSNPDEITNHRDRISPPTLPSDPQPTKKNTRVAIRKRQAPAPPSQLSQWSTPSQSVEASGTNSVSAEISKTQTPTVSTTSRNLKPVSPLSRTVKLADPTTSGTCGEVSPAGLVPSTSNAVASSKTEKPISPISTSGTVNPAGPVPSPGPAKPVSPLSVTSKTAKPAAVKTTRSVTPTVTPDPKRDLPYYSAVRRKQTEETLRAEQNARNLALGLPPVLDPAAKLEKLRKLDALQNPIPVDSDDYKHTLQGRVWANNISPGHTVGSSAASRNITNGANENGGSESPTANECDEERLTSERSRLGDVEPMSAEQFRARLSALRLRPDRFGDIRASLRDLRRGLNEVTAPYNNNNSSANNNATVDSNILNYRSDLSNGSDQFEEARACSPAANEVQLPCEFCGELQPAAILHLHQEECVSSPESGCVSAGGGRRGNGGTAARRQSSGDDVPIIPCEFCTEPLPYYLLTEHQELCGREADLLY